MDWSNWQKAKQHLRGTPEAQDLLHEMGAYALAVGTGGFTHRDVTACRDAGLHDLADRLAAIVPPEVS